jgi:hypothetical protein
MDDFDRQLLPAALYIVAVIFVGVVVELFARV